MINFKMITFFFLLTILSISCAESSQKLPFEVFPANGKVEFNGSPLSKVVLIFNPINKKETIKSSAITDTNGIFSVTTFTTSDGLPEGEFLVTLAEFSTESDSSREDAGENHQKVKSKKLSFPSKYLNEKTTPLKLKFDKSNPDLGLLEIK